jgi:uncharacterized integral membrane protein (TIGR00698 family)
VSGACLALTLVVPAAPALLVAIVLGVVARSAHAVPASFETGLAWSGRRVLRIGVVLLGLQLSARDVLALGPAELGVLLVTVATTFSATLWFGRRLRVGRTLTLLVATGFSICGAAAVAAMSPVADADDDDVATAVALVTLYGSAAILVVPVIARAAGLSDRTAGLWAGMSIHEVGAPVPAQAARTCPSSRCSSSASWPPSPSGRSAGCPPSPFPPCTPPQPSLSGRRWSRSAPRCTSPGWRARAGGPSPSARSRRQSR